MVQVGSTLPPEEYQDFKELLMEFSDIFAWFHQDMPGIDLEIVEHQIPLLPNAKPVKQKLRRMRPNWVQKIKDESSILNEEVLTVVEDVWTLYFDGAANQKGYGIGVLLITPDGSHISLAFKLNFDVTNNQAEYEACIVGMEAALTLGVEKLKVIGDSNLVLSQANGDWKVRE
ncbi:uncharacterized protein LOC131303089 [Rhododendron vialii]|uniref:uncharacterized protein LOC131303089 n=1 Tax=Rhododendron vialii TaxID=182163 RepID=UPI002660453A|nr:uncharacterized protein LOC131303089 [Rhododendron vialii]